MRYLLGVLAGILSGLVFTAASIAQKRAMNAMATGAPLFRTLARSPLWLLGFVGAFAIGAPLNMVSYMAIGPTLPPALSSIGLAAVPILARFFLRERPPALAYAGAAAVALAVSCIGLSGMAIAPEGVAWLDHAFLLRAAVAVGAVLLAAAACLGLGFFSRASGGIWLALGAGACQAVANALMAPIAGQLGLLASGKLGLSGLLAAGLASIALAAVNFGAIAVAQLALSRGTASLIVPTQQLPIQLAPLVFHVALYRGDIGSTGEAVLLATGFLLLVSGVFALGRGNGTKPLRPPAAVLGLVLILVLPFPSALGAQEAVAVASDCRNAIIDGDGRLTGTLDIRVITGPGGMEIVSIDSAGLEKVSSAFSILERPIKD